jgi:Ni/Co efflux regulator RcnB
MKNFVIATVSAVALLSTAAIAEENSATMLQEVAQHKAAEHHQKSGEHCSKHHHKKHHKGKHHRHHVDRGHPGGGHPLWVAVNFPPVNVAAFSACPCEYYQGNQEFRYIYHEGYYWYPQMRADLLAGYQPCQVQGYYWYPSIIVPHAVYIENVSPFHPTLYPVQMGMGGAMPHGKMHKHHGKMHHRAHHAAKHHAAAHHGATAPMKPVHPAQPGM